MTFLDIVIKQCNPMMEINWVSNRLNLLTTWRKRQKALVNDVIHQIRRLCLEVKKHFSMWSICHFHFGWGCKGLFLFFFLRIVKYLHYKQKNDIITTSSISYILSFISCKIFLFFWWIFLYISLVLCEFTNFGRIFSILEDPKLFTNTCNCNIHNFSGTNHFKTHKQIGNFFFVFIQFSSKIYQNFRRVSHIPEGLKLSTFNLFTLLKSHIS